MRFEVWGLRFRVSGLGFRNHVLCLGFGGSGFLVEVLGFGVLSLGLMV